MTSSSRAQQVSKIYRFHINNKGIESILDSLEKLSTKKFYYSSSLIPIQRKITYHFDQASLMDILIFLFPEPDIQITELDQKIIISKKDIKKYTFSGYIKDAASSENLIGVSISDVNQRHTAISNAYGFFSLDLPEGNNKIRFSYVGYKTFEKRIQISGNTEENIIMQNDEELEELIVKANEEDPLKGIQNIEIPLKKIGDIPAMMGENDVIKYLSLTPGVSKGTESNQGMFIRGGTPDQNLIMVDDATIYSAYHLFGINSLFSGSELRHAELNKSGFSAKYGGRTAAVLNMSLKDGNRQEFDVDAGLGLLASHLQIDGPLVKNKSSILFSARRTYVDLLSKPFFQDGENAAYYYYDINAKMNLDINPKNRLYFSLYNGHDLFKTESSNGTDTDKSLIKWGNSAFSFRWNTQLNNKLFLNTTCYRTSYSSLINVGFSGINNANSIELKTGIVDVGLKTDFDYTLSNRHWIKTGLHIIQHQFTPSLLNVQIDEKGALENLQETKINGLEMALYVEDKIKISKKTELNAGLRMNLFRINQTSYFYPEPRLQLNHAFNQKLLMNLSYTHMTQYVNLISTGMLGLPSEIWIPSTENLKPQIAKQISGGYAWKLNPYFTLSQEFYYKKSKHTSAYRQGAGFLSLLTEFNSMNKGISFFESLLTQGQTEAYGTELSLNFKKGKFESWFCYNLGKINQQFDDLNRGRWFDAFYDRRHDLNWVGIYKPNKHWTFSISWIYGSGFAMSLPTANIGTIGHAPINNSGMILDGEFSSNSYYYPYKNNYRTAATHRMDFACKYQFKTKRTTQILSLSIYNVYNRANPFYYDIDTKIENGKTVLKQISFFPTLPSFSWRILF
ncbi:MAG: TonB-dependent receptor [Bacteroidia bacterium]